MFLSSAKRTTERSLGRWSRVMSDGSQEDFMSDWKLAYHANCWGSLGGNAQGVTSITELRYRTFGDMDGALSEIAAACYAGVELFDGNLLDYSATGFRKLLADNGLTLTAAYSGGNFIFDDI